MWTLVNDNVKISGVAALNNLVFMQFLFPIIDFLALWSLWLAHCGIFNNYPAKSRGISPDT